MTRSRTLTVPCFQRPRSRFVSAVKVDREAPVSRQPDAVDVARILDPVDAGLTVADRRRGRCERRDRVVVEPTGADELDVVVRLERIGDRRRVGERGGDVEQAEAGGVVPPGRADVDGRAAHHLEQLRCVELGPHGPDPGARARDERCREARAVAVAPALAAGGGDRDVDARVRRDRRSASVLEKLATAFVRSVAADREDVGDAGGIAERVAGVAVVARRGDDERALRGRPRRSPARSRAPSRRSRGSG